MIINQVVQGGGGSGPAHYIEKTVDANGKLVNGSNVIDLTGVTDVDTYVLSYSYRGVAFPANTSLDFSSLVKISGERGCTNMFVSCTGITSVDISSLTTVSGQYACNYMFSSCAGITSVDISSLTTVNSYNGCSYMFSGCAGITSVDISSLTTVSGQTGCGSMFQNCTGITSVDISSLTTVSGGSGIEKMFFGCTNLPNLTFCSLCEIKQSLACYNVCLNCTGLTSLSFPCLTPNSFGTYTNQFNGMLSGVTGCTVHFPSNIQSTIGTWSSVTGGFGGTNTTVLFDLPATNTLTGADTITYTRNPKYDTATALAWKVGAYGTTNFDPAYYTSGTTDPAVGDTIYSDAACTTSVTTITAIA